MTHPSNINNPDNKKQLPVLAGIFVFALSIRLAYLYQVSKNPVFFMPLVDSQSYNDAACKLAEKGIMDIRFFWQAFFYPMFLTVVYSVTNCSIVAAKLIQALLGSLVVVLVYSLGRRIFDRRTAVLAAIVTSLYGPLIFFGGELLATTWASLWALVLILLFLKMQTRQNVWICLGFGICGGLSIVTRATFLPFFAAACMWLALAMHRSKMGWKRILLVEKGVIFGFLLVVIPVSIQCYRVTGLFSPLPETGPINLYIGNNYERREIMAIRPGGEWEKLMLMPVREGFRTKAEAQRYFLARVRGYVTQHPFDFAKRLARKTVHFFSSREIPNNTDIYANREYSPLYSVLTWKVHGFGFPFGVLLPFAVIGMIYCRRRIPAIMTLFMVLYPLSIILVFVTARYRAPMIPVMVLIASTGFWRVHENIRGGQWITVSAMSLIIFVTPVLSSVAGPFAAEVVNFEAEKNHFISLYYRDRGELAKATEHLKKAIYIDPSYSDAYQSLGIIYVSQGKLDDALACFKKAIELNPDYYSAHNNLGALLGRQGKYEEALGHFKRALELNPHSDSIYANIGIALVELRRFEEASGYFKKALFYSEAFGNRELARRIRDKFGEYLIDSTRN